MTKTVRMKIHGISDSQRNLVRCASRNAFTLVESAMATLLVGLLVVGSLKSLTASFQTHHFSQSRVRAAFLAEQLLIEISCLRWFDSNAPSTARTIGRDAGDPATVTRRDQLDDMDDFDDWVEQPPSDRSGTELTGTTPLRRRITVENISGTDSTVVVADDADSGIRRITVTVDENGLELARISVLLTRAEISLRSGMSDEPAVPNAGTN